MNLFGRYAPGTIDPDGKLKLVEQQVIERAKALAERADLGNPKRQIFTNIANRSLN